MNGDFDNRATAQKEVTKNELRRSERELHARIRKDMKRERAGMSEGWFACGLAVLGIFTIGGIFVPLAAIACIFGLLAALVAINLRGILLNVFASFLITLGFVVSPSAWIVAVGVLTWLAHK